MKPYYNGKGIVIYNGDCRDVLTGIPEVDSVITDPPYGLNFMDKEWDRGVPGFEFFELIKLACKPGAIMMAFGGTRSFHRLTCSIEDAGWEIRDCLMWLYGSGFPKSLDISKAIDKAAGADRLIISEKKNRSSFDPNGEGGGGFKRATILESIPTTTAAHTWNGWGTALKPAWEPIILAMKPLAGTFAENAEKHGVAGLNIDGCRIGTEQITSQNSAFLQLQKKCKENGIRKYEAGFPGENFKPTTHLGRWPANLLLDEESAAVLDEQSGESKSTGGLTEKFSKEIYGKYEPKLRANAGGLGDSGGASRFFYCAKASNDDRGNREDLELPLFNDVDPGLKNIHPTVKPLDLMEKLLHLTNYLCKLTSTPTSGVVLDPFMGSGTTLIAAKKAGRQAIGIEKEEKYCEIAAKRLSQEVFNFEQQQGEKK